VPVGGWVNYPFSVQVWKSRKTQADAVKRADLDGYSNLAAMAARLGAARLGPMQIRFGGEPDQSGNTTISGKAVIQPWRLAVQTPAGRASTKI
jgi:hypothetical protein